MSQVPASQATNEAALLPPPVGLFSHGLDPYRLEFDVLIAERALDAGDLLYWDEWYTRGSC